MAHPLPIPCHFADEVSPIVFRGQVRGDHGVGARGGIKNPRSDATGGGGQPDDIAGDQGGVKGAKAAVAAGVGSQQRAIARRPDARNTLGDIGGVEGGDAVHRACEGWGDAIATIAL